MSMPVGHGAVSGPLSRPSISSSHASGNLAPSEEKILMPLSSKGLCEADRTTPPCASSRRVR